MSSTNYQDVTIYHNSKPLIPYLKGSKSNPELIQHFIEHPDTSPAMKHFLITGEAVYTGPIIREEDVAD